MGGRSFLLTYCMRNILIFEQDNDPKHIAGTVKRWFQRNEITVMKWRLLQTSTPSNTSGVCWAADVQESGSGMQRPSTNCWNACGKSYPRRHSTLSSTSCLDGWRQWSEPEGFRQSTEGTPHILYFLHLQLHNTTTGQFETDILGKVSERIGDDKNNSWKRNNAGREKHVLKWSFFK